MNRTLTFATAAALGVLALSPVGAFAAGNLASQPTVLELGLDGRNLAFSANEYTLETGKYYRWEITSDGIEEIMIQAPDLFRNSWINQLVINDKEIHANGGIYGIEYDDAGTVSIAFVPLRPGDYEFYAVGHEERGMIGTFHVTGQNVASQPTVLELALDGRNLTFSSNAYTLETGKYYRWEITSDGIEEMMIQAPDLLRNSWVNQYVVDDLEVHVSAPIYGIEFDDEGTVEFSFVPIRPGDYEFYAVGHEARGMIGTFTVR